MDARIHSSQHRAGRYLVLLAAAVSLNLFAADAPDPRPLAKASIAHSLKAYADKEQACAASKSVLPEDALKGVSLSKQQLTDVLSYFYLKTLYDCSAVESSALVSKLIAYQSLAGQMSSDADQAGKIIASDLAKLWQAEAKFVQLDPEVRLQLSGIQALAEPFDMIQSAERLGL